MYDQELLTIIRAAFSRLFAETGNTGEYLGEQIRDWVENVYQTQHPQEAFLSPRSYPMLLLPYFAECTLAASPDTSFQTDLVYSTVNGYYYVRLLDNLMDGHGSERLQVLPMLNFFHTQFQLPYQRYFPHQHPFWDYFKSAWFHSAEVTMQDAQLAEITRDTFMEVSAQKTCAAKIPLAAVFYQYDSIEQLDAWAEFVDLLGCWHQAWNDIFDWVKDTRNETPTYFLSEANRRKQPDEPVIDWVIRKGFDWGISTLDGWMDEMRSAASQLNSPQLDAYLDEREALLEKQKDEAQESLNQIASLLTGFKRALDLPES